MPIEHLLPEILNHVDLKRFGERRARMLLAVHHLQKGRPCAVYLGRKQLRAGGRSDRQAKYDHGVLVDLAALGCLRRNPGQGRTPDAWSLREIRYWHPTKIPWLGRRSEIISLFSLNLGTDPILLWPETAGQSADLGTGGPLGGGLLWAGLSGDHLSTTESHLSTTVSRPGNLPPSPVHNGAPSLNAFCSSKEERINSSSTEEEERLRRATRSLALAIARQIGKPNLFARPLATVEAVARRYPDRADELGALVACLHDIFGPQEAADTFEAMADRAAESGWPAIEPPRPLYRHFEDPEPVERDPDGMARLQEIRDRLRASPERLGSDT